MTRAHDVIITGLPRSGTTLTCHLLNKVPNTVALSEPYNPAPDLSDSENHAEASRLVRAFFDRTRAQILDSAEAPSKHVTGVVPDNPKGDYPGWLRWLPNDLKGHPVLGRRALRRSRVQRGTIRIEKHLARSFLLCVKHNGPYTALLPELKMHFRCFAVVRNPLAVLASWNSISFGPCDGHDYAAEMLLPRLKQQLDRQSDRYERQLHLLSWFYDQYREHVQPDHVVRYEELIASGGRALGAITPDADALLLPLRNKNQNKLYNRKLMQSLGERLLARDNACWHFYSQADVRALLESSKW